MTLTSFGQRMPDQHSVRSKSAARPQRRTRSEWPGTKNGTPRNAGRGTPAYVGDALLLARSVLAIRGANVRFGTSPTHSGSPCRHHG